MAVVVVVEAQTGRGARGRDLPIARVLDDAVGGEELGGEVGLADAGVGGGEGVLAMAEGAEPEARGVLDPGVGVQNGAALGAEEWLVREDRELRLGHQWRADDAERDDQSRRVQLRRRPRVPGPPEALDRLQFEEIHWGRKNRNSEIRWGF